MKIILARDKFLLVILIVLIIGGLVYFYKLYSWQAIKNIFVTNVQVLESKKPDENLIAVQQINNVGYSFYLGQIDYPEAPKISDTVKNKITTIIADARFPKKLLRNLAIIIVNTLAVKPGQYVEMPTTKIRVRDFSPDFLRGGGIFSQFSSDGAIIFMGKNIIQGDSNNSFKTVLTHELGHHVGSQLTDEEWSKYYQLRGIPKDTSKRSTEWRLSPFEDFAEVYKNIFTGDPIQTGYGLLVLSDYCSSFNLSSSSFCEKTCDKIYEDLYNKVTEKKKGNLQPWNPEMINSMFKKDPQIEESIVANTTLQNCRRNVFLYPEKYPEDYKSSQFFGAIYKSVVDQKTKDFVVGIINGLNQ